MTELATFTPYAPPYWDKRVWDPKGRNAWERKALVALELGSAESLEKLLIKRERSERWRKPYGKTRAFALDIWADIMAGNRFKRQPITPQRMFQDWRADNARWVEDLDVDWDEHKGLLANWEEAIEKRFNYALRNWRS